jgi:hypothetical protein
MAAGFSDPRLDLGRMAAVNKFVPATIRGQIVPARAAVGSNGVPATEIGRTIGLAKSMIGTNGTIGARTITSTSTTIGTITGATTTIGLTTTGGMITTIFIGTMAQDSIAGVGLPGEP